MWVATTLVLLAVQLLVVRADVTLSCPTTPQNERFVCTLSGIELNDFLSPQLEDAIVAKARAPENLAELLPPEWSTGVLEMAGVNSEYCKSFCFPASQECTSTPLGEVCTPQACETLCVPIPGYDTLNVAPASLVESALDAISDGLENLARRAVESIRLLPAFSVQVFVTADCDPGIGFAFLVGSDVIVESILPVSQLQSGDTGGAVGDALAWDVETRRLTVDVPVPLTVGLVTAQLELAGVVVGTQGATVGSVTVTVTTPDAATVAFQRDDALVVGVVDPCYEATTCTECAALEACSWCSTANTCSPTADTCPCTGACVVEASSPDACLAPSAVCWVSTPSAPSSELLTVSEYAEQLGRLGVLTGGEATTIALAMDTNGDAAVSQAEVTAYAANTDAHPTIQRVSDDGLDAGGIVAVVLGVCCILSSAVVVAVGLKRPHALQCQSLRRCRLSRAPRASTKPSPYSSSPVVTGGRKGGVRAAVAKFGGGTR